jgi:HEAT repeat protein
MRLSKLKLKSERALITSLKDQDASVCLGAASALMCIRPSEEAKETIPLLVNALKDEHAEVRMCAAFTLGNIGLDAQAAVPHLIELLKDPVDRRIAPKRYQRLAWQLLMSLIA